MTTETVMLDEKELRKRNNQGSYLSWAEVNALLNRLSTLDAEKKAAVERAQKLEGALVPFSNAVFNDNGEVTYDYTMFDLDDLWRAYCVLRTRTLTEFTNVPEASHDH